MSVKRSISFNFLFALLLGLGVVLGFDQLDVSALSSPVCLALVLMGISLRQTPAFVTLISLVYFLLVTYSALYFLHHSNPFHVPLSIRLFGLVQREGVFAVVCAMAIYMAFYRAISDQMLADVRTTVSKLPVPVVISDAEGFITYTNESLNDSLEYLPHDLVGKKYVDFFMPTVPEGKAMRRYVELFGSASNSVHEIDLMPFGSTVPMLARLTCHGTGSKRSLITVLQPPDSTLRELFESDTGTAG